MANWNEYPPQIQEALRYQYEYNVAWMKLLTLIDQNTIHVEWNHHRWTFTDEEEAWKFAHFWKLL